MPEVLACITAFRDKAAVRTLVDSLRRTGGSCDVVVYDNTVPPLGDFGPRTVSPARNGGTAASLAWAVHEAHERGYEFLWMLDQDSQPQEGCLAALVAALGEGGARGAGAAAPRAFDPRRGAVLPPAAWGSRGFEAVRDPEVAGPVSGAILSGLLIRVEAVRGLALPRPSLFLDWVDYALCAELERAGRPCVHVPHAHLTHALGGALIRRSWRGLDVVAADYPTWRVASSHRNRIWVEATVARRRNASVSGVVRARLRDAVNGALFLAGSDIRHRAAKGAAAVAGALSGLALVAAGVSCYACTPLAATRT